MKYTDTDGNVFHDETTHEFGEPTYETRCVEGEEIREEVEDIPGGKIPTVTKTNERSIAGRQRARRESCEVSTRGEANLREGSRVLALWFDKHYCPGTLMSRYVGDSKCRVQFDDGDFRDIRERDLLVVDYLAWTATATVSSEAFIEPDTRGDTKWRRRTAGNKIAHGIGSS